MKSMRDRPDNSKCSLILPNTARYAAGMVYPYEFVAGGGYVKIRLFLVDEERVGHPNVLDELRTHGQRFHSRPFLERQPGIGPELSEVKVQREVLECEII